MLQLLTTRCLWEYVDPSYLIFTLVFDSVPYDHLYGKFQIRRVATISCKSIYAYMYGWNGHDLNQGNADWQTAMVALAYAALVQLWGWYRYSPDDKC